MVRKIPWSRKWQLTPVFLPGKFHGQRSLTAFSPWYGKESDTTQRLLEKEALPSSFICFLFIFWPHHDASRILVPQQGIEPKPPAVQSRVLTTGPLGKSQGSFFLQQSSFNTQTPKPLTITAKIQLTLHSVPISSLVSPSISNQYFHYILKLSCFQKFQKVGRESLVQTLERNFKN